jgi:hypothetical protein
MYVLVSVSGRAAFLDFAERLRFGRPVHSRPNVRLRMLDASERYQDREVAPLHCPTCRTNLGTYSPRTLGRRAERGETLLLP